MGTKEAQAVADAEATIAKMEKQKKDMTAQFEAQKKKVDAMPEVQEMMKMGGQMESAVKDYDSSVPRMKAKLPATKKPRRRSCEKRRRRSRRRPTRRRKRSRAA